MLDEGAGSEAGEGRKDQRDHQKVEPGRIWQEREHGRRNNLG